MLRYRLPWIRIMEKYYYRPTIIYIEIPWANLKKWFKRFKRYHVDLTFKEFWLQLVKFYPQFISRPENELYSRINGMDALKKKIFIMSLRKELTVLQLVKLDMKVEQVRPIRNVIVHQKQVKNVVQQLRM